MRTNTLGKSLVFAIAAAMGLVPFALALRGVLGSSSAIVLYGLGVAVAYVIAVAPSWARGLRIGALAALLGGGTAFASGSMRVALVGAALSIALCRSGFLYRSKPARALLLELITTGGGLVFASALLNGQLLGWATAFWGFFLVQGLYFVFAGVEARPEEAAQGDAFSRAREKAIALMEEAPH